MVDNEEPLEIEKFYFIANVFYMSILNWFVHSKLVETHLRLLVHIARTFSDFSLSRLGRGHSGKK